MSLHAGASLETGPITSFSVTACLRSRDSVNVQNPNGGEEVNSSYGRDRGELAVRWLLQGEDMKRKSLHVLAVVC